MPLYKDLNNVRGFHSFLKNEGQWDPEVLFCTSYNGVQVGLEKNGISFTTQEEMPNKLQNQLDVNYNWNQYTWKMQFVNSNKDFVLEGEEMHHSNLNFFKGNDPTRWVRNTLCAVKVFYKDVYPNVDMKYYKKDQKLKYDLIVHPGGKLNDILIQYNGITELVLDTEGKLMIKTPVGKTFEQKPYTYQKIGGRLIEVESDYILINDSTISYKVGGYNPNYDLIIDPITLDWGTYIGGYGNNGGQVLDIAIDDEGRVYGCGVYTETFPSSVGFNGGYYDAFVFRLNENGSDLEFGTYLGGSNPFSGLPQDAAYGIDVNNNGQIVVTGSTSGADFPITENAFVQSYNGGNFDGFVTLLNNAGNEIVYSSYLGGTNYEIPYRVKFQDNNIIYITGKTGSDDFPVTSGGFDETAQLGDDAFLVGVDLSQELEASFIYGTYIGGEDTDIGVGLDFGSNGNIFISGTTKSTDFPSTNGAAHAGLTDSYILQLNPQGTGVNDLIFSTLLGGSANEEGRRVAVDAKNNSYIIGSTNSNDYLGQYGVLPTTTQLSDFFVTKVSENGDVVYSTFLAGSSVEYAGDIEVNCIGEVYANGVTNSGNLPESNCEYSSTQSVSGYFFKLDENGELLFSSYFGGTDGVEFRPSLELDNRENVYISSSTTSTDFHVSTNAYQGTKENTGSFNKQPAIFKVTPSLSNLDFNVSIVLCDLEVGFAGAASGNCIYEENWENKRWNWNFGDGTVVSDTLANYTYEFSDFGSYDVTLTIGCGMDSITKTVVLENTASNFDLGPDLMVCPEELTIVDAGEYVNYQWNTGSTDSEVFVGEGLYSVTITDEYNCQNSDSLSILYWLVDTPKVLASGFLCEEGEVNLEIEQTFSSYLWSTGETFSKITISDSGKYSIEVVDVNGCITSNEMSLDLKPIPVFDIQVVDTECDYGYVVYNELMVYPEFSGYNWSNGSQNQSTLVFEKNNWVEVKNMFGCLSKKDVIVSDTCVFDECVPYFPNTFTPNQDEVNESIGPVFYPSCQFSNYSFSIFNRWGQEVFNTTNPFEKWNGTFKGTVSPEGIYTAKIQYIGGGSIGKTEALMKTFLLIL